jgi:ribonuclease VapC
VVIDTSALLVLLGNEPGAARFREAIEADPTRLISAATVLESSLVVESRWGEAGGRELDLLLLKARAELVPFDHEQMELAREAWRRFGKGRHPAGLNFGDCFSYALARYSEEPLLFQGNDFTRTDIAAAVPADEP